MGATLLCLPPDGANIVNKMIQYNIKIESYNILANIIGHLILDSYNDLIHTPAPFEDQKAVVLDCVEGYL